MLYQMFEDGRHDDAARYYAVLKEMPLEVLPWFAQLSADEDERKQALHFLNAAHHLDPDDADIAARLRSIRRPDQLRWGRSSPFVRATRQHW